MAPVCAIATCPAPSTASCPHLLTCAFSPRQNWVRHVGALHGPANPWFQQRAFPTAAYVTEPATPWFPFGYGLSYSNFTLADVVLSPPGPFTAGASAFNVSVTVRSSGPAGSVVVQASALTPAGHDAASPAER